MKITSSTTRTNGVEKVCSRANVLKAPLKMVEACLWFDGGSTSNGENDVIPAEAAVRLFSSLKLVRPNHLLLRLQMEGSGFRDPKQKVRGYFSLGKYDYAFSVTDTFVKTEFKDKPEGTERVIERPILCISVSEIFEQQNACYKLIAGVLE